MKLLGLFTLCCITCTFATPGGGKLTAANAADPGQEFDITSLVMKGKVTIIDFYSDYCPPCRQLAPMLKNLHENDNKYHVVSLDVNRPKKRGIDWQSPLARQYGLQGLPYFMVYDEEGKLLAKDDEAYDMVAQALRGASN